MSCGNFIHGKAKCLHIRIPQVSTHNVSRLSYLLALLHFMYEALENDANLNWVFASKFC